MSYSAYYEFIDWRFGNFIEKDIIATNIKFRTIKGGCIYTILDSENKTYFFSTTESSKILRDSELLFAKSPVRIRYNVRNNEISEVSYGTETEKRKFVNLWLMTFWLIITVPIILIFIISSIKVARFDKSEMSDNE